MVAGSPDSRRAEVIISKLLWFLGATVGGAIGWWLGALVGTMTAVILSAIGTGVGIYAARRFSADYF